MGTELVHTAYIPQGVFGYDENAPIYEYDLDMAAELMKQTPYWETGFTVSVSSSSR